MLAPLDGVPDLGLIVGLQGLIGEVGLGKEVAWVVLVTEGTSPEPTGMGIDPPGQGIGDQVTPVIDEIAVTVVVPAGGLEDLGRPQTGVSMVATVQEGRIAASGAPGPIELLVDDPIPLPGLGVKR